MDIPQDSITPLFNLITMADTADPCVSVQFQAGK